MIDAVRSLLAAIAAVSILPGSAASASGTPAQPVILKLNSVACASPAYCLAVGQDVTQGRTFAELWDGNAWRVIPAPDPGTPETLWDVACFAIGRCVTVGTYFDAADIGVTLAAEWNGTAWRLLSPVSPGADDQLGGIACPRRNDCVAVGATLASGYEPLAEQWDGVTWHELPSPAPGGSGVLNAVACPSPARCLAVGSLDAADGTPRTLAALWDGSHWRVLPTPPIERSNLVDVSCAGPARCVATGYSYPSSPPASGGSEDGTVPGLRMLTEQWDGKEWQLLPFGNPVSAGLGLGVGIDIRGAADAGAAAGAGGSAAGQLLGVACGLAAARCLAVGDYVDSADSGRTLAAAWDGGSSAGGWRLLRQPAYLAGADAVLTDVACLSPGRCMAVGDYDDATSDLPFADFWNGRQWQLLTMPA